jgi:16S rRNA (cytosine1402-N4)-methyltransferase
MGQTRKAEHVSVLLKESIELLQPRPGAVAIDCTLGLGGHARALLQGVSPGGRLLAIDRDAAAVEAAQASLSGATIVQGDFGDLARLAPAAGFPRADAILFDLGVSSVQLDEPERGFSFSREGPLDMRLDRRSPVTAERFVNQLQKGELARLIRELGEERWAARVAEFIVRRRPLRTTKELAAAVEAAIPRAAWPKDIHPATRTFQAIRMAVNDELGSLERGLKAATQILSPGGRMATICFHSLEDRLVKSFLNVESKDCVCPPQQPVCTCAHRASLRVLTRHVIRPSEEEVRRNPRSRSAKLRAAERI